MQLSCKRIELQESSSTTERISWKDKARMSVNSKLIQNVNDCDPRGRAVWHVNRMELQRSWRRYEDLQNSQKHVNCEWLNGECAHTSHPETSKIKLTRVVTDVADKTFTQNYTLNAPTIRNFNNNGTLRR